MTGRRHRAAAAHAAQQARTALPRCRRAPIMLAHIARSPIRAEFQAVFCAPVLTRADLPDAAGMFLPLGPPLW